MGHYFSLRLLFLAPSVCTFPQNSHPTFKVLELRYVDGSDLIVSNIICATSIFSIMNYKNHYTANVSSDWDWLSSHLKSEVTDTLINVTVVITVAIHYSHKQMNLSNYQRKIPQKIRKFSVPSRDFSTRLKMNIIEITTAASVTPWFKMPAVFIGLHSRLTLVNQDEAYSGSLSRPCGDTSIR